MNGFERAVADVGGTGLCSSGIEVIQVNVGFLCNQQCAHCHVNASPYRTETMAWETMELVLAAAWSAGDPLIDITGGAPELNPHLRGFVTALRCEGRPVQVRTNLSVLLQPGQEDMPEFFRDREVRLVASLLPLNPHGRALLRLHRRRGIFLRGSPGAGQGAGVGRAEAVAERSEARWPQTNTRQGTDRAAGLAS